jgi:hypothetical protein
MKRRDVIKSLAILPVAGTVASSLDAAAAPAKPKVKRKSVYEAIARLLE